MQSNDPTIILQDVETKYKLMKIFFTNDGSYAVTAPYHNQKKAFVCKATIDYTKGEYFTIDQNDMVETSILEDDKRTLKISHHPSGFLHFSGNGIRSGINVEDGTHKGIGVQSWTFDNPAPGPSFSVTINNYKNMEKSTKNKANELCIRTGMIKGISNDTIICVEGYFIPKIQESIIYKVDNAEYTVIKHPSGGTLHLHVVRPTKIRNYYGFIGLHVYALRVHDGWKKFEYTFSTSSGDLVWEDGKMIKGNCLIATYPNMENQQLSSLNWMSDKS